MTQPVPSASPPTQYPMPGGPQQVNQAAANLQRRVKMGANNFYWIGALSVVNSLISAFGGGISFVIGLAATQFVDGFAIGIGEGIPELTLAAKVIGLVLSIVISGIIALFGYFAGRGFRWAFITGMFLYGLDALIMLAFGVWVAFLFHLYFLWGLFSGLQALNKLEKALLPQASDFPQNIGVS